jgi:hypothetical protein
LAVNPLSQLDSRAGVCKCLKLGVYLLAYLVGDFRLALVKLPDPPTHIAHLFGELTRGALPKFVAHLFELPLRTCG